MWVVLATQEWLKNPTLWQQVEQELTSSRTAQSHQPLPPHSMAEYMSRLHVVGNCPVGTRVWVCLSVKPAQTHPGPCSLVVDSTARSGRRLAASGEQSPQHTKQPGKRSPPSRGITQPSYEWHILTYCRLDLVMCCRSSRPLSWLLWLPCLSSGPHSHTYSWPTLTHFVDMHDHCVLPPVPSIFHSTRSPPAHSAVEQWLGVLQNSSHDCHPSCHGLGGTSKGQQHWPRV